MSNNYLEIAREIDALVRVAAGFDPQIKNETRAEQAPSGLAAAAPQSGNAAARHPQPNKKGATLVALPQATLPELVQTGNIFSRGKATVKRYKIEEKRSKFLFQRVAEQYNEGKKLGERLREPHLHLFTFLLDLQWKAVTELQDTGHQQGPGHDLPTFYTNNPYLGALMLGSSERKIRYLLARLKQAGLIDKYTFHGRKHDFELRLSKDVLYIYEHNDVTARRWTARENVAPFCHTAPGHVSDAAEAQEAAPKTFCKPERLEMLLELFQSDGWHFLPHAKKAEMAADCGLEIADLPHFAACPNWQTLPPKGYLLSYQLETNKLNKVSGQNSVNFDDSVAGNLLAGNETQQNTPEQEGNSVPGGAAARPAGEIPKIAPATLAEAVAHLTEAEKRHVTRMVKVLWKQSLGYLYSFSGCWLSESQEKAAFARLAEYFCYHSPTKWAKQYTEMQRRIILAHRWLKKENAKREQNGQSAFRIAVPGTYFDIRNQPDRHFLATKAWYKRDLAARIEIARTRKLNEAIREYQKAYDAGDETKKMAVYNKYAALLTRIDREIFSLFKQNVHAINSPTPPHAQA